jgi:hypothetical protein
MMVSLPLLKSPSSPFNPTDQTSAQLSDEEGPAPGIFQLLFIPDVLMAMLSLFVVCVGWTFYEPDLANHLSTVSIPTNF